MPVADPPKEASNAELARWAFDALNRHDLDALSRMWNEDTVERFPDETVRGTEAIRGYFERMLLGMPDLHMDVVAVAEQGDDVFVRWRMTGTHLGPLAGIEPTGKRVEVDGIDHFVIRDGTVVSNFVVHDQMQSARQIGMMPPDGAAADRALKAAFNARTKLAERFAR